MVIHEICLLGSGANIGIIRYGIVKRLTTNLNLFCEGDAMKRLLKSRFSKEREGLCLLKSVVPYSSLRQGATE